MTFRHFFAHQKIRFPAIMLMLISLSVRSQDSLRLSIDQAEERFLKTNLLLLAGQLNVNARDAMIIQARTFSNPVLTANFNVYDPENGILFHDGPTGQKDFMLEQLLLMGGKRRLNVELARNNKTIAEAELADLLRSLRYQLHESFYLLYRYQTNIRRFDRQLDLLDSVITAYQKQADRGNLAMKDVIRLKAIYLRINAERATDAELMNDYMKNLQLLVREPSWIVPAVDSTRIASLALPRALADLQQQALQQRPDLLAENNRLTSADVNRELAVRQNIPDLTFNVATDQRGGAFRNQISAGVSLGIPVWNQNRGNIRAARVMVDMQKAQVEEKRLEVTLEVNEAYQLFLRSFKEYRRAEAFYDSSFESVFQSVNNNFMRKNISLIEYVDFIESYHDALQELERIRSQLAIGAARLNYVTASKIY